MFNLLSQRQRSDLVMKNGSAFNYNLLVDARYQKLFSYGDIHDRLSLQDQEESMRILKLLYSGYMPKTKDELNYKI